MKSKNKLLLVPLMLLTMACPSKKSDELNKAGSAFMSNAQRLEWYGPAREALIVAVEKWHRNKRTPVPSATELSSFVNGPFDFTVGGGIYAKKAHLPWSAIHLEPIGKDKPDPRYYVYKIEIQGVAGTIGVEGL